MSIKYNNKVIAGKYKEQVIPFANTIDAGIAKIATQEQINEGTDNTSIVTPVYLAQKQDKLTAGEGIHIDATNTISSKVLPDKVTIIENDNKTITTVARKTINEKLVFDWEGTEAEYHQAIMNGEIDPDWYCYITDDELSVSYNDVLSRTLVNIAPDGIKVLGASNAYLTNDVYIDEAGYNQLLELKNSAIKIDGVDNLTINGQEVAIPYVLTHTGSKIVDVKYRDTLVEFYNENGYTNYFTIDEENKNYTLPMGEIYGKLVDKDLSDISDVAKDTIKDIAGVSFNLFDTKLSDHVLSLEESVGWALQGTYVYKEAITGERFGYPTFYERCIEEKNAGTAKSVTLGSSTITMYVNDNGHQFYNIADKSIVDTYYTSFGIADFYGIDEENECIFLPRNKWFMQLTDNTANVNKFTDAGLPNITGDIGTYQMTSLQGKCTGAFTYKSFGTSTYGGYASSEGAVGANFNASRSSAVYGKSTTVQPKSSSKLLYYCVGNTKADTSWINIFAQVEEGIKEIYDQKAEVLEEIDALRETSVDEIGTLKQDSINEIDTLRATSVNEISTLNTGSLDQIEALKDKSISEINVLKVDSTNEINTLKRTSLNEISTLKQDSVDEIDTLRQNSVNEVDTLRETTVEEIGTLKQNSIDEMEDKRATSNESIIATKDESVTELLNATADKIQEAKSWSIGTEEERPEGSAKYWAEVAELSSSNALFDTKIADHILKDSEAYGWELQGTYVYKNAVIGKHLGYPTFYETCVKEYELGTPTEVTLGENTITMYVHENGHQYYNIDDKSIVDTFYNIYGIADFYGLDTKYERVFLPRNKYFHQLTDDTSKVNEMVEAGLPNITGDFTSKYTISLDNGSDATGAFETPYDTTEGNYGGSTASSTWGYGLKFDASRSSAIYGNSDTVQPQSSLKLLYYCVGNIKADTSWMKLTEQVEAGVKEIEDKRIESIEDINNLRAESINQIDTLRVDSLEEVDTLRLNSVDEILDTKQNSLNELEEKRVSCNESITTTKEESIEEINITTADLINQARKWAVGTQEENEYGSAKYWSEVAELHSSNAMFDTKTSDHILQDSEAYGWELQGTWVYKEAVIGEHLGYSTFYEKCIEEKSSSTATSVTLGSNTITMYINTNGHQFYDIADKGTIDTFYNTHGIAWYYGIDEENERILLPRNNWFEQLTGDLNEVNNRVEAGLPNITGTFALGDVSDTYTAYTNHLQYGDGAFYSNSQSTASYNEGGQSTKGNIPKFDASRSNKIYGKSTTVQPPASKKLLYICVANTKADTSWMKLAEQVEAGIKDIEDKRANSISDVETLRVNSINEIIDTKNNGLQEIDATKITNLNQIEDLTLEGIHTLAGASNALNRNQIANCLIEVPQRIKYTLVDGTLTILAGSVVIVPNGFEVDGTTPKFDYVTLEWDVVVTPTGGSGVCLACLSVSDNVVGYGTASSVKNCVSGAGVEPVNYGMCYDTSTNIIQRWGNGTVSMSKTCLPLMQITQTDGVITSIDQTFNGLGYIGSTVWVDKGVKGLIPNGRNLDGTLNNIEFTTQKLLTTTNPTSTLKNVLIVINSNTINRVNGNLYQYDAEQNLNYNGEGKNYFKSCVCGSYDRTSGVISNFNAKLPFRAVDYSSLEEVHVVVETYNSGYSWYRVWSDGWCEQGGMTTAGSSNTKTVTLLKPYRDIYYTVVFGNSYTTTATATSSVSTSVKATTGFSIIDSTTTTFYTYWQTSGYME